MPEPILIGEHDESDEIILSDNDLDFLNEKINANELNSKIEVRPLGENRYILKARHWVGSIKIPNSYSIIIRPKVGNLNFLKMLAYSENFDFKEYDEIVYSKEGDEMVDLMAKLFLEKTKAIVEDGIYKSYVSVTEEIPTIKGRLLVVQNIRKPRVTQEKLWCEYDELSTDVLENQILLYCAEVLSSLVKTSQNRTKLYEFQNILQSQGVSEIFLESYHLDKISIQKLNEYYSEAFEFCYFILNQIWYGDFTKDERIPSHGLLFDMNDLFQNFVTKVCQEIFMDYNVIPELRNSELLERLENENKTEDVQRVSKVNLKPDIVFKEKKSSGYALIVDTKYKDKTVANDIYQAIAYSMAYGCSTVLLVPQINKKVIDGFRLNPEIGEIGKEVFVYVRSIDFSSYENNFIDEIKEKIKTEISSFLPH